MDNLYDILETNSEATKENIKNNSINCQNNIIQT